MKEMNTEREREKDRDEKEKDQMKTFSLSTKSNLMHIAPWSEDDLLSTFIGYLTFL